MSTPTDLWIVVASIAAWITIVAVVMMFADKAECANGNSGADKVS
jgi:hypothetical protein